MMRASTLAGLMALGLSLSGCATVNPTIATPNQEYVGLNAYYAALQTGNNYLALPLCGGSATICRTRPLSLQVARALVAVRAARKQITVAIEMGMPAPLTALDALQAGYSVIQQIKTGGV